MSKTSRSAQSAPAHTLISVGSALAVGDARLEAHALALARASARSSTHVEARQLGLALGVVDRRQVDELVHRALGVVAQERGDLEPAARARRRAASSPRKSAGLEDALAELRLEALDARAWLMRHGSFLRICAEARAARAAAPRRARDCRCEILSCSSISAVEHGLGARRTAGDVDVDRDELVDARARSCSCRRSRRTTRRCRTRSPTWDRSSARRCA